MKTRLLLLALTALCCVSAGAQGIKIKGVAHDNRYKQDGETCQMETEYIGSLKDENGNWITDDKGYVKAFFIHSYGLYAMDWNGISLSSPYKEPAVNKADLKIANGGWDIEKVKWANNFNLMLGNSGAVYRDGIITTITSRDYQSTTDEEIYAVRQWDAVTGNLLTPSDLYMGINSNLESAGMSYNPKDGKVYGLFHFVNAPLNQEITGDPEYFTDEDDKDWDREGMDDGYAIGTIDLNTMEVTQITPGLYYQNFITFAINSDGRAFALTSGATNAPEDADGKHRDINNVLTGAQLCEFDLSTGLMQTVKTKRMEDVYDEGGNVTGQEEVEVWVNKYQHGTGYMSKYKRQSACFAKSNPNIMYWVGYYNSGKGINNWGSWGELPDRDSATGQTWVDNHKYDTCLYAVDINTGDAERLANIDKRFIFSCLWVDGDDCSDGAGEVILNNINSAKAQTDNGTVQRFNLAGQQIDGSQKGIQLIKSGNKVVKVMR